MIIAVAYTAHLAKDIMSFRLGFQPSEYRVFSSVGQFRGQRGPIRVFLLPGWRKNKMFNEVETQATLQQVREVEFVYVTEETLALIAPQDFPFPRAD